MPRRKKYIYVDHTADVEYIAYGRSIEECFGNAMLALFDTASYVGKVRRSRSKKFSFTIRDRAKTLKELLWYSLQDAVSITDSRRIFGYKVESLKIRKVDGYYSINASVSGKAVEERTSKLSVKGVSRYNLWIKERKQGFEASIVLDV